MSNSKIYFDTHPRAKYWAYEKNGDIMPKDMIIGGDKKYWFNCDKCSHTFEKSIRAICRKDSWCPFCKNKVLCNDINCDECYNKSFANHPNSKFWDYKKNIGITPRYVFSQSRNQYWFKCDDCNHEYKELLCNISNRAGCSYCIGTMLCNNDCNFCKEKSFESHPKSKYWNYEKNNEITPRDVFKSSSHKYWFKCNICLHNFDITLHSVSTEHWCRFCASLDICNNENCNHCENKSFNSHPKAKYWDYEKNENIKPRDIFKSTPIKYWFKCDNCNHSINISPQNIVSGYWCGYCSYPPRYLCDDINCNNCNKNSFISNPKSEFWDYEKNNNIKPRNVFRTTSDKYWFKCNECNSIFQIGLGSISIGYWCSICINKTEKILYDYLVKFYPTLIHQYKPNWSKNIETDRFLPYDLAIEDYNLIIELDGRQHFKQVSNWQTPEETQIRDIYKMQTAMENGYSVIRLLQEDVYRNKNNWDTELLKHIYLRNQPECVFICSNDEYDSHIEELQKVV